MTLPTPVAGPAPLPQLLPTVPPTLLHEKLITDAHEVLVLSYTSDLQFFESTCLGDALASTGRVTVVRDADKGVPAAEARLAGTRYLDVPVRCRSGGAFHPKLVVVAGPDKALAAIGSGNVTPSGWHYNAELWTVIAGEGEQWPVAFEALADWLDRVPSALLIDDFGARRIREVAALLRDKQYSGGPRLVHNLDERIIEQLGHGPVQQLAVASPFLDGKAAALRQLQKRFEPIVTKVALSRGASFDADALADALEGKGRAALISSAKYHHGKLVQWDLQDGASRALVGSPNCTAAAMLMTSAQPHGNCELGLVVDVTGKDLMPKVGDPLDRAGLLAHAAAGPPLPADRASGTPFVARALRAPAGLQLTVLGLKSTLLSDAELLWKGKTYPVKADPARGAEGFAHCLAGAGELVSVQFPDGTATDAVAVTDPARVMVRLQKPSPLERDSLAAVLGDPTLTGELLDALEQLASVRPTPPSGGSGQEHSPAAWLEAWAMSASAAVGQSLVSLALGQDPAGASTGLATVMAVELPDEPEPGDIDQEDDEKVDQILTETLPPDEAEQEKAAERHRRRVVALLLARADSASGWELPAQLALLRVLTISIASGLFHEGELWSPAVAALAVAIAPASEPEADETAKALASHRLALAAVCLAMIAREVTNWAEGGGPVEDFLSVRAVLPAGSGAIDSNLVRAYATGLDRLLGVTMGGAAIVDSLDHLLNTGPLTRLAEALSGDNLTVDVAGPRLLLVTGNGAPRALAFRVLTKAQSEGPLVVVATNPTLTVALAWNRPNLVEVTSSLNGRGGRLYRTVLGIGPVAGGSATPVERWQGGLPSHVQALLLEGDLAHSALG